MADRLPSLTPDELIRVLLRAGLEIRREGRRHTVVWKEGIRPIPIERHAKELKRGVLADIIKQAGLTQTEFLDYHRGRKR